MTIGQFHISKPPTYFYAILYLAQSVKNSKLLRPGTTITVSHHILRADQSVWCNPSFFRFFVFDLIFGRACNEVFVFHFIVGFFNKETISTLRPPRFVIPHNVTFVLLNLLIGYSFNGSFQRNSNSLQKHGSVNPVIWSILKW